jgi:competence protein ComEA
MFKRFLAALLTLLAFSASAVEVNTASQAQLESIKGIGPAVSSSILAERKKGHFKDWNDLVTRVKGVGATSAAGYSAAGLTVNAAPYSGAAGNPPAARTDAPAGARSTAGASRAASATTSGARTVASASATGVRPAAAASAGATQRAGSAGACAPPRAASSAARN